MAKSRRTSPVCLFKGVRILTKGFILKKIMSGQISGNLRLKPGGLFTTYENEAFHSTNSEK